MQAYNVVFPWIVMILTTLVSSVLVAGGTYTGFVWATLPPNEAKNETYAGNLYAGVWVFVGSCLAAMVCLWIAKQILTY